MSLSEARAAAEVSRVGHIDNWHLKLLRNNAEKRRKTCVCREAVEATGKAPTYFFRSIACHVHENY